MALEEISKFVVEMVVVFCSIPPFYTVSILVGMFFIWKIIEAWRGKPA